MKPRIVETEAQHLVNTSVDDAISGAWNCSIAALKRAIQIEQGREQPRVALIRGLQTEINRKEARLATAPRRSA